MPLTLAWAPAPGRGPTLVVMFAYHGRDRDGAGRQLLESPAAHGHRIVHRDHYANPRSFEYMLAAAVSALSHMTVQPADVVIDSRWDGAASSLNDAGFNRVVIADPLDARTWREEPLKRARDYQNVLLVYPDALGLGCGAAEARALGARTAVFVVNGRRRAFRLTHGLRRRLGLSRMLAHTRLVERALAAAVTPFAAVLAKWDQVRERS